MKRLLALAAAAFALPALASTHSTDYTDLWYLPAESGWGVNVVQQNDIVFATFFVYGPDGTPRCVSTAISRRWAASACQAGEVVSVDIWLPFGLDARCRVAESKPGPARASVGLAPSIDGGADMSTP